MSLKKEKKIGLTTKIFIALLLGAILGIVLYSLPASSIKDDIIIEGILYVIGQGFIKLMKMLVVPLVFCSLVCGSMAIGDTKKLGSVGVRTILFYLFTTALAITVALLVGNLINPGTGLDMSAIHTHPLSVALTFKILILLKQLSQFPKSSAMNCLYLRNLEECRCSFQKSFFLRHISKSLIDVVRLLHLIVLCFFQ